MTSWLWEITYFIQWRDVVEISILWGMIHTWFSWIMHAENNRLLTWSYGFCSLFIMSWWLNLPTLGIILYTGAPCYIMLCILFHHNTLQKLFITHKTYLPETVSSWPSVLIQAHLYALHHQKDVMCIIERSDSLNTFLQPPYEINADISYELLITLIDATVQNRLLFWISSSGKLIACNPSWNTSSISYEKELTNASPLIKQACCLSTKTDCFILYSNVTDHTFSCFTDGTHIPRLSSKEAYTFLNYYKTKRATPSYMKTNNSKQKEFHE